MKEHIAHSGAWGIALIVIVVASWFLYRYLLARSEKSGKNSAMNIANTGNACRCLFRAGGQWSAMTSTRDDTSD